MKVKKTFKDICEKTTEKGSWKKLASEYEKGKIIKSKKNNNDGQDLVF
jgi:hypothetical protein